MGHDRKSLQTIQETVGLRPAPALCKTPARSALPWLLKVVLGDETPIWLGHGVLGCGSMSLPYGVSGSQLVSGVLLSGGQYLF